MSKKYYAVKVGRKTGIFEKWSYCKEQTNGYPRAIFKSFSSREEAVKLDLDRKDQSPKIVIGGIEIGEINGTGRYKEKLIEVGNSQIEVIRTI